MYDVGWMMEESRESGGESQESRVGRRGAGVEGRGMRDGRCMMWDG